MKYSRNALIRGFHSQSQLISIASNSIDGLSHCPYVYSNCSRNTSHPQGCTIYRNSNNFLILMFSCYSTKKLDNFIEHVKTCVACSQRNRKDMKIFHLCSKTSLAYINLRLSTARSTIQSNKKHQLLTFQSKLQIVWRQRAVSVSTDHPTSRHDTRPKKSKTSDDLSFVTERKSSLKVAPSATCRIIISNIFYWVLWCHTSYHSDWT